MTSLHAVDHLHYFWVKIIAWKLRGYKNMTGAILIVIDFSHRRYLVTGRLFASRRFFLFIPGLENNPSRLPAINLCRESDQRVFDPNQAKPSSFHNLFSPRPYPLPRMCRLPSWRILRPFATNFCCPCRTRASERARTFHRRIAQRRDAAGQQ